MKTLIPVICILQLTYSAFSQDENSSNVTVEIVEPEPSYDGSLDGFYKYLAQNFKYPEDAEKQGIEGEVFIEFKIDENGYIIPESVKVAKGIDQLLDNEAIRLVKNSPKWDPDKLPKRRKKKNVRMILPIKFKL